VGGDPHRKPIVEAARARGLRPVVGDVVDVHHEVDDELD
jgi:hypothetical protein